MIDEANLDSIVDSSTEAKAIKKLKRKIKDCEDVNETSIKQRKTKKKSIKDEISLMKKKPNVKKEVLSDSSSLSDSEEESRTLTITRNITVKHENSSSDDNLCDRHALDITFLEQVSNESKVQHVTLEDDSEEGLAPLLDKLGSKFKFFDALHKTELQDINLTDLRREQYFYTTESRTELRRYIVNVLNRMHDVAEPFYRIFNRAPENDSVKECRQNIYNLLNQVEQGLLNNYVSFRETLFYHIKNLFKYSELSAEMVDQSKVAFSSMSSIGWAAVKNGPFIRNRQFADGILFEPDCSACRTRTDHLPGSLHIFSCKNLRLLQENDKI